MKKMAYSLCLLALSWNTLYARTWEAGIVVSSGTQVRIWKNGLYTHDAIAGSPGESTNCGTVTFYLDIGSEDSGARYGPSLSPGTTYTIVIGGRAVDLTTPSQGNDLGDFVVIYDNGNFSLCIAGGNPAPTLSNQRNWVAYDVTVKNSFNAGNVMVSWASGGGTYSSGVSFVWENGTNLTLQAIDRQNFPENGVNYVRVYQSWDKDGLVLVTKPQLSATVTVNVTATYTANFKKEYCVSFQNNFAGAGNGGVIKVN